MSARIISPSRVVKGKFNLDLSFDARLGSRSAVRTHRGKERFPGMIVTCDLIQTVERIAETMACKDNTTKDPFSQCESLQGIRVQVKIE